MTQKAKPNKRGLLFTSIFGIGNITLLISRTLDGRVSDFSMGFLEGMSIAFITLGTGYLLFCVIKKKNPLIF